MHSGGGGGGGAPSRRPHDPPAARRRPREQVHLRSPAGNGPVGRAQYLLDSPNNGHGSAVPQHYYPQQYSRSLPDSDGGRDRPTLRRRGSSSIGSNGPSQDKHAHHTYDGTVADLPPKRAHYSTATTIPTARARLSRIVSLAVVGMLMLWASFRGIETSVSLARGTLNFIFGRGHKDAMSELQSTLEMDVPDDPDGLSNKAGLRGAPDGLELDPQRPEHLTIYDLNAKSHELKAEGRQVINDRPMEADEDGEGDKSYMGSDSTNEFFFAGSVTTKKKVVNERGRVETLSQPARSYAVLPFSVDANPFALSVWIYLSPTGGEEDEADRRPRVILSTRTRDARGCQWDIFQDARSTGIVLYAQPHFGDEDSSAYRIVLEYARSERNVCPSVVGSHQSTHLVREGNWHHIAAFSTRLPGEGGERISLYVNGNLAAREVRARLSTTTTSKTIVGRHGTNDESEIKSNSDNFGLGGRVGMLSFWETGGRSSFSNRMTVQTESDEDHVVRAINRAAFDVRAIKELSLQGLFVKAPSLLFSFDEQKDQHMIELYSYTAKPITEAIAGRDGEIMSELDDGTHAHQREAFAPLGGNRYAEYKDGTFAAPRLTAIEREELDEIARARSNLVKNSMQHVWRGYEKYAYGKDELLPLSKGG